MAGVIEQLLAMHREVLSAYQATSRDVQKLSEVAAVHEDRWKGLFANMPSKQAVCEAHAERLDLLEAGRDREQGGRKVLFVAGAFVGSIVGGLVVAAVSHWLSWLL